MNKLLKWLSSALPSRLNSPNPRRPLPARPTAKHPARFAPHLESLEDRQCPSSVSTTINAKDLSITYVDLEGGSPFTTAGFSANKPYTHDLSAGSYTLYDNGNFVAKVTFTVAKNGSVSYDAAENGVLSGSGTNTLTVLGCPITVNATALSLNIVDIDYNSSYFQTDKTFEATVLPGNGLILDDIGGFGSVTFNVSDNGVVGFSGSESKVLALGATPSTLVVKGCPITVNATALSLDFLVLNARSNLFLTDKSFQATVLPGNGIYLDDDGDQYVTFNVNDNDILSYPNSENGVLSGAGSSTLTIDGCPITVNATALSIPTLNINGNSVDFATNASFKATVLPGDNYYLLDVGNSLAAYVTFNVAKNGTVNYPGSENSVLSGSDSKTLTVKGCKVNFNATGLSLTEVVVDEVPDFSTASKFSATLLPGGNYVLGADTNTYLTFTVSDNDTLSYNGNFQSAHILGGQGSNTLTIYGETIKVDATALYKQGVTSFTIAGVGTLSTKTVQSLNLLPGWQSFSDPSSTQFNFLAEVVNPETGTYDLVDYDPSLDNILSGAETDTLTVVPLPVA
jgi:hypothetical protein